MVKPSGLLSSRNQKSRGFKAKLALKTCLILVITIWMIYQLKLLLTQSHSPTKGVAGHQGGGLVSEKQELMAAGGLKLGRKGLILIDDGSEGVKSEEREKISSEGIEDGKSSNETSSGEEDEQEVEEEEEEEEERSIEDLVDGMDKDGDEEEQLDDHTEEDNILQTEEKTTKNLER